MFVITYYGVSNLLLVLFLNYLKQKIIIKDNIKYSFRLKRVGHFLILNIDYFILISLFFKKIMKVGINIKF